MALRGRAGRDPSDSRWADTSRLAGERTSPPGAMLTAADSKDFTSVTSRIGAAVTSVRRVGLWLRGRGWPRKPVNTSAAMGLGVRLGDRYALIDCIGAGGMGEVWSARDEVLDRVVAVKVLAGPLVDDPALRAAIRREAKAAARLVHPHVTRVFDFGEQLAGSGVTMPYLVMELVQGVNLQDRLRLGALPWAQAVEVGADVADALAATHRIAMVHLDIKPDNVMLTPAGAKVLDFGIAALAGRRPLPGRSSRVGTPTYSAPERLHDSTADPAADVFSLGVLLYECLVGRPPRRVDRWGDMAVAQATPVAPVDVPGLPAEVAVIVGRCLHPDPAQRPTVAQVAWVLAAAAGRAPQGHATAQKGVHGVAPVFRPTMIEPERTDVGLRLAAQRYRPGRLGLVAIVGVAAALVIVAVLIVASLSRSALTRAGTNGAPAPSLACQTATYSSTASGARDGWEPARASWSP